MELFLKFALVFMLLAFVAIGVANVVHPDYFIARSGVRKGGELLTAWNRIGFRIAGAIFACSAAYMLLEFLRGDSGGSIIR